MPRRLNGLKIGRGSMAGPIHALKNALETARLNAVQELAAGGATPRFPLKPFDELHSYRRPWSRYARR